MLTANIATALADLLDHIRVIIILWGPPLLLGILVYLMWRLVKMMPRTSPSELKPDAESIVRWHDVAGVEEAKAELAEIIEFLRDPVRFERLGARVPRGVLLHGPPGTGKTLLAKAVAAESGAAFFSQPASAFVEMFAGLGASRIRKLFETARKHAPAIIFIDELDAVGAARQNVGFNREQDQTLNQLLVELDGFKRSDVVIMASTNRLDTLDAALLRPGRFDRQVYVSPPDLVAREQILNVHVRNKPVDDSVELTSIARATAGLTGADLENICNEAAIRATRAGRDSITNVDFDDALERVVAGLKTHRTVSEDEKRVIAYHEAGHAVVAHIVGRGMTIHKVTIVPRGGALGYNMYLPTDERVLATRDDLITRIVVLFGGRAGEQVALGAVSNGAGDDLERSTAIARAMVFDWGLGESMTTRTVRADNFALSEDTKRQARSGAVADLRLRLRGGGAAARGAPRGARAPRLQAAGARDARPRGRRHDAARRAARRDARVHLARRACRARTPACRASCRRGSAVTAVLRGAGGVVVLVVPARCGDLVLLGLVRGLGVADARCERAEIAAHRQRAGLPLLVGSRSERGVRVRHLTVELAQMELQLQGVRELLALLESARRLLLDLVELVHAASHRW